MKTNFSDAEGEFCAVSITTPWRDLERNPNFMAPDAKKAGEQLRKEDIDVYNSVAMLLTQGGRLVDFIFEMYDPSTPNTSSEVTAAVNNHLKENKYNNADDLYEKSRPYISYINYK